MIEDELSIPCHVLMGANLAGEVAQEMFVEATIGKFTSLMVCIKIYPFKLAKSSAIFFKLFEENNEIQRIFFEIFLNLLRNHF